MFGNDNSNHDTFSGSLIGQIRREQQHGSGHSSGHDSFGNRTEVISNPFGMNTKITTYGDGSTKVQTGFGW